MMIIWNNYYIKNLKFMKQSNVYLEDCMIGMARYPDNYFDLAIVDPPYGINRNGMNMGNSVFNKDDKKWDNSIPTNEYFIELFRVSKNQIIWGGNYFPLPQSQYFAIWDKGETMYGRDFAECEFAWVKSGGTRIYKKSPKQPERIHPTQKPVALYKWLLQNYAKQGDKILDTHLGSGSSRIAAYDMGFDFTAFELDKEYFEAQEKRFNQFKSQLKLF
jgi:site-specific DNA-methyltransferase (adenine-specific)